MAAVNSLGTGEYGPEVRLVAADPPGTPTLNLVATSRTLTGFQQTFIAPAGTGADGGSPLIGYLLERDEGVAGSPYTLVFNGTSKPGVTSYTVTGLVTAQTYSFKLYALNKIFQSTTPGTLTSILVGTLPDRPTAITRVDTPYAAGTVTTILISWVGPTGTGGLALTGYEIWVDDGAGTFSAASAAQTPAAGVSTATLTGLT